MSKSKVEFFFDADAARAMSHRPKCEREITKAAFDGLRTIELCYESRKVCHSVHDHLHNLGFVVSKCHSRKYGAEHWFKVSW